MFVQYLRLGSIVQTNDQIFNRLVIFKARYFEGSQGVENHLFFIFTVADLFNKCIPEICCMNSGNIPHSNHNQAGSSEFNRN